jgi:hypothetical protein
MPSLGAMNAYARAPTAKTTRSKPVCRPQRDRRDQYHPPNPPNTHAHHHPSNSRYERQPLDIGASSARRCISADHTATISSQMDEKQESPTSTAGFWILGTMRKLAL